MSTPAISSTPHNDTLPFLLGNSSAPREPTIPTSIPLERPTLTRPTELRFLNVTGNIREMGDKFLSNLTDRLTMVKQNIEEISSEHIQKLKETAEKAKSEPLLVGFEKNCHSARLRLLCRLRYLSSRRRRNSGRRRRDDDRLRRPFLSQFRFDRAKNLGLGRRANRRRQQRAAATPRDDPSRRRGDPLWRDLGFSRRRLGHRIECDPVL